jgi:hypothetical protein
MKTSGFFPPTDGIFDASLRKALSFTVVDSHRFLSPFSVSYAKARRAWDTTAVRPAANRPGTTGIRGESLPVRGFRAGERVRE